MPRNKTRRCGNWGTGANKSLARLPHARRRAKSLTAHLGHFKAVEQYMTPAPVAGIASIPRERGRERGKGRSIGAALLGAMRAMAAPLRFRRSPK